VPALHAWHDALVLDPAGEDSPVAQVPEQFVEPASLLNRPAGQVPHAEPPTPRTSYVPPEQLRSIAKNETLSTDMSPAQLTWCEPWKRTRLAWAGSPSLAYVHLSLCPLCCCPVRFQFVDFQLPPTKDSTVSVPIFLPCMW
jgi:hypothetical protein